MSKDIVEIVRNWIPPSSPRPRKRRPPRKRLPPISELTPDSRLPHYRNPHFTGRQADLFRIADHFFFSRFDSPAVPPLVIYGGQGGVGKTQLAVEFSHRYAPFFLAVHWIHADLDIPAEIASCGRAMGLQFSTDNLEDQVEATLHPWRVQPRRLVVFDNLESPAPLAEWRQRLGDVYIMATSRHTFWSNSLSVFSFPLELLPPSDSLALLRELADRLKSIPDLDLNPIRERLDDLPLALYVAGLYLSKCATLSPGGYLKELDLAGGVIHHKHLQGFEIFSPTGHTLDFFATFQVSFQLLNPDSQIDLVARRIFCAAGYCASNTPIPAEILMISIADEGVSKGIQDEQEARNQEPIRSITLSLSRLVDLGLLELSGSGYLIHPLLAEFARLKDSDSPPGVLPELAQTLAGLASNANDSGLPAYFAPLRPHVRHVAGAAEAVGLVSAGSLWNGLGVNLNLIAQYAEARAAFERALKIAEASFGPDHPNVASAVNNLGSVLQDLGDLDGARLAYERALKIDETSFGPDHPKVATDVNNLGGVLRAQGNLAGARLAYERALKIDEASFGPNHPNVATDLNNLGLVLKDLGDLSGARTTYERALAIFEQSLPPNHPIFPIILHNLESLDITY